MTIATPFSPSSSSAAFVGSPNHQYPHQQYQQQYPQQYQYSQLPFYSTTILQQRPGRRIRDQIGCIAIIGTKRHQHQQQRFASIKDEENDLRIVIPSSDSMEQDDDDDNNNNNNSQKDSNLDIAFHNTQSTTSPRKRRTHTNNGGCVSNTTTSTTNTVTTPNGFDTATTKDSSQQLQSLRHSKPAFLSSSIVLLNIVAIIWGSQHAIIKTIVQDTENVAAFTLLRFGLASIIALPYLPGLQTNTHTTMSKSSSQESTTTKAAMGSSMMNAHDDHHQQEKMMVWNAWRWGTELGLWMFLGFSLQAVGLLSTTAQRSGFLLYLNVKFVPFFAYLLLGRQISNTTWISAVTAFSGTALLALDGQSMIGLNIGDVWSVLAAMASAMFILRLETATLKVAQPSQLNAVSLLVVATLSGIWLWLGQQQGLILSSTSSSTAATFNFATALTELKDLLWSHPVELLYLGVVSTALSNFLQAKAQKDVPAERASIIYSLDPVYGALFSYLLLGETLGGVQSYVGAAMIFIAAATNSILEFTKPDNNNKD
ncbi:EamA-like transporter family protein [Nitzschia inconspicua]|uniref:EamA-like transporter family protein n=1 Tax=Nitzschia inconspicua TaxID=303405 RepID=A0A9K3LLA1_9STRA|nr:EamA-like transporter family protein [Nitzschia inconspicua]